MTLLDDKTVSTALRRDFHTGKMLAAALLRTTALLGPSMMLSYARAYAQTVCAQSPAGTVSSGTSFICNIPAGTQTIPQVFYTGYGMWYSGRNNDSQPGLPITITNNAEINVTGNFVTGEGNSQASNYAAAFPTGTNAGPRGEIISLSGALLAFNTGSDNIRGNDVNGGAGATVTLTSNGSIKALSFGIAAYSSGGQGSYAGGSDELAGDGGSAGAVTISVLENVAAGTGPAVFGASYGGNGGRTGKLGRGGSAGAVTLSFGQSVTSVTAQNTGTLFESVVADPIISGSAAAVISYGGVAYRDNGGNAGNVSISALDAEGTRFTTGGAGSPALFARSYGGIGNASGYTGGTAGTSTVMLSGSGTVTTTGVSAPGIVAQSMGGAGQSKDVTSTTQTAATGGVADNTSVSNSFTISTTGSQSHGIVAQSAGAGGGLFNYTGAGNLTWGDQNVNSGAGAAVTVTNSSAITTAGPDANGIVAQSIGGGGGHVGVGENAGTTTVGGTSDSVSGNAVTISNSGSIMTLGQRYSSGGTTSYGGGTAIVAQSIGGGGGTMAGGHGRIGGKGTGSTGGTVSVTNASATLSTAGVDAHGILAQSIGGGGGQGRNSTGLFVATGGQGGSGGNAGTAQVYNSASIAVSGDYANGIMVQSIGGGGGTGGRARAIGVWGIAVADAHGGSGGAGGAGSSATASNSSNGATGSIVTRGLNGTALIAQSIGGGGGSGGAAKSISGGAVSVALAFGGSGGGGGAGGAATVNASGNISTYGYDSIGILSQSLGGGGGQGGTASAKSFSVGVPIGPDGPDLSAAVSIAHGGSSATVSAGGAASAINSNSLNRVIEQTIQTSANRTDTTTGAVSLVTVKAGTTYSGITTFGDNSTGMLVQSIGGGGGSGGDATANSSAGVLAKQVAKLQSNGQASDIENINFAVDVAIGGTGGGGGAGGTASASNEGTITTFGLFSDGMVIQSIGGGGGQGGTGNAKAAASGAISVGLNVAIGASGGAGGAGGQASGGNGLGGIIVTGGNNSRGILVQSIGAGGGNSGGGGGSTSSNFGLSIGLGSSGATGGAGGSTTAWNYGAITTSGDWSDGITAQSIGGGGGNGGAGDSSLSITSSAKFNNSYSVSGYSTDTDASTNGSQSKPTTDTFAMSLGTTGGGGGNAGTVVVGANDPASGIPTAMAWAPNVTASAIRTSGNNSNGLMAQSIGGGGGNSAISPQSSSAIVTLNIGASGAGGGAGGNIFAYSSNIATYGFSSHGVLAQSVGGGGGMGVAGGIATTINTKLGSENVQLETGAGAGTSNNGGGVSITTQVRSRISTGGPVTIAGVTTNATDSFGILAQSIGGGGGAAAAAMGSPTASTTTGTMTNHTVTLGGGPTASTVGNNGGRVAVYHQGAIVTSGDRGFGIAAQSIGGGGGLVSAYTLADVNFTAGSTGNGGEVEVSLSNGASIATSGAGAFGAMAQSIGGGGGFAANSNEVLTAVAANDNGGTGSGDGSGGNVSVTLGTGTTITTTGSTAHGIFAQSVTGGGGVWDNGTGGTLAGTNRATSVVGGSGPSVVSVNVEGSVAVFGSSAWGVWAQNAGNSSGNASVSVNVSGSVVASGGATGAVSMSSDTGLGQLTIEQGGSVTGNIRNNGSTSPSATIAGFSSSYSLSPSSAGYLLNNGILTTADYVTGLDVTNTGMIDLGGTGTFGRTTFSGDLSGKGNIGIDVDLASGRADHLVVEGNTVGSQMLRFNALALIKGGTAEFMRTLGDDQVSLAVEGDSLFSFELGAQSGKHTVSVTDANFVGAASLFGQNATAAAYALQSAWDISDMLPASGSAISMGKVFAQFNGVEGPELENRLLAVQSFSSTLSGSRAAQTAISAANGAMSCPAFEGDGMILSEGQCMWLRGAAGRTERDNTTDLPGYVMDSTGISLGAQTEIAPDWFLGGTISALDYDTDFSNGNESVSGTSTTLALSLKRQVGSWLFSGAIGGSVDDANSTRQIELGDLSATAYGAPDSNLLFARARVAYEVPYDTFYIRPMLDLDLVNFRRDGYSEVGAGDLNLNVDAGSDNFFAVSPALEIGGRVDYDNGNVMRIYGVAGVSFVNQDSYTASANLAGAPDAGLLNVNSSVENTVGRFGFNMELITVGGFEIRAGYDFSAGGDVTNQTGQFRVAYRF